MKIFTEFREFALKGNVIDLAVAVIIGGAFGKIVTSMIEDMIMPIIGLAGKADFTNLYVGLNEKVRTAVQAAAEAGNPLGLAEARKIGPVLAYGNFITITVNFLILAACMFLVVKMFNTARKRFEKEQAPAGPPELSTSEKLLVEIRDLLKGRGDSA